MNFLVFNFVSCYVKEPIGYNIASTSKQPMKYLKFVNAVLNCFPFVFAASLYTFYYWLRSFRATHEAGATSESIGLIGKVTRLAMPITFYSIIPNFILICTLVFLSQKTKEKIKGQILFYSLGIGIMLYLIFFDPADVLYWFID